MHVHMPRVLHFCAFIFILALALALALALVLALALALALACHCVVLCATSLASCALRPMQ